MQNVHVQGVWEKSISAADDCLLEYLPLGLFSLRRFIRLLVAWQWKSLPWLPCNISLHGRAQSKAALPRAAGTWSLHLLAGQSWCPRGCTGPIPGPAALLCPAGVREQSCGVASYRKYRKTQAQERRQDMLMLFPLKGKKSSIPLKEYLFFKQSQQLQNHCLFSFSKFPPRILYQFVLKCCCENGFKPLVRWIVSL